MTEHDILNGCRYWCIEKSIEKLAAVSDVAKSFIGKKLCVYPITGLYENNNRNEDFNFHPNGKCGCIEMNDEYLFGIRCDHFMWADGELEYRPFCKTEATEENGLNNCVMVYGNHKGHLEIYLVYVL